MAETDITAIVLLISFFIIFGVFLLFDLFKRNEKYAYFAYIIVLLPVNYLWYLTSIEDSVFENIDSLMVFLVLFILFDICILRDLFFVHQDKKEFDDILLFLLLALFIQLIISAILPFQVDALQADTEPLAWFWLPNVHSDLFSGGVALGFKLAATIMVILAIIPMILDIKDEQITLPVIVIISIIFYLPFLYLSFVWLPNFMYVLAFLMCLVLFIALLLITKSD